MLENAADIDFLTDPTKDHQSERHWLTFRRAVLLFPILPSATRLTMSPKSCRGAGGAGLTSR